MAMDSSEVFDFLEQVTIYDDFDTALVEQGDLLLGTSLEDAYNDYKQNREHLLKHLRSAAKELDEKDSFEVLDRTE